jgi:hypothetical protein
LRTIPTYRGAVIASGAVSEDVLACAVALVGPRLRPCGCGLNE